MARRWPSAAQAGVRHSQAGIESRIPATPGQFSPLPLPARRLRPGYAALAQLRRETGQVRIPDAAREGDYDLVCFGSPTWFFTTNMPLRSYLKSDEAGKVLAGKPFAAYVVCRRYWSINLKEVRKLGIAQGGEYVDGTRFSSRAARSGRCSRCSATSARARCASAPWGEDPADQSQAGLPRAGPRRSRASWRTASTVPGFPTTSRGMST